MTFRNWAVVLGLFTAFPVSARDPVEGRVVALAPVIWACPLENWNLGDDDGCDPIETGTPVRIFERGIRPDYRHGPFAQIEYTTTEGKKKIQYVKDSTVAPIGEHPSVSDMIEREIGGKVQKHGQ